MTPPRLEFIREEYTLPDPYLLLGTAKQHLADHNPMELGDMQAWEVCHQLQMEVELD